MIHQHFYSSMENLALRAGLSKSALPKNKRGINPNHEIRNAK